jgi:hypothetical protein
MVHEGIEGHAASEACRRSYAKWPEATGWKEEEAAERPPPRQSGPRISGVFASAGLISLRPTLGLVFRVMEESST